MILSDLEILAALENGRIVIEPFDKKYLNPNSVDLTLNPVCKVYKSVEVEIDSSNGIVGSKKAKIKKLTQPVLDCRKPNEVEEFTIPEEGFVIQPKTLYLYSCNERIGVPNLPGLKNESRRLCAEVNGKSSLGRLGIWIHLTAGFIDSGFVGSLVLELACVQPVRIYPNMKICQLKFMSVLGNVEETYDQKAGSKYMNQTGVQESKMHENWNSTANGGAITLDSTNKG